MNISGFTDYSSLLPCVTIHNPLCLNHNWWYILFGNLYKQKKGISSQVPQLTQPRPYPASFEDCIFIQPCAPIVKTKIYSDNQEVWSSCSNHVIFAALSNNIWCWVLTLSPLASFSTLPPTSFLICPTVHTHLSPHIFWSSVRLLCRMLSCLCTAI